MNGRGMLKMAVVAAIGVTGVAVGASEHASFIDRVKQSQGIAPSGAEADSVSAPAAATRVSYGEPASFIARVEKSQGVGSRGAAAPTGVAAPRGSYGEPTSFIARVARSQGVGSVALLEGEDQLSPEQIRLVQRALTAKGHAAPVTGKLDERTRSALVSFQRSQSLPVSGTLDSRTIDALGFAPSQVTPVRGPGGDAR